jgi:hypothetical protein
MLLVKKMLVPRTSIGTKDEQPGMIAMDGSQGKL